MKGSVPVVTRATRIVGALLLGAFALPALAESPVDYAKGADDVVVRYRENLPIRSRGGGPAEKVLTVYGDGRVHVRLPEMTPDAGDHASRLTRAQLDALVHALARTHRLTEFDPRETKRKRDQARDAKSSATGTEHWVSDPQRIEIELNCDGASKKIAWSGLRNDARRFTGVAEIQGLRRAQQRLLGLIEGAVPRRTR